MRHLTKILLPLLILVLLAPLAQTLRTQNPWNCFQLTTDEAVYLQASYNWSQGRNFYFNDHAKPYDPYITAGVPLAWGITATQKLTHWDWPQAGRFWTYLNTAMVLLLFSLLAWLKSRNTVTLFVSVALFSWILVRTPEAPYTLYGILSEMPGAVFLLLSLILAERKSLGASGLAAGVAAVIKPTYIFFAASHSLASLIKERRIRTGVSAVLTVVLYLFWVAHQRNETFFEYLRYFSDISSAISGNKLPDFSLFAHLWKQPLMPLTTLLLCLGLGGGAFWAQKRKIEHWALSCWLTLVVVIIYFLFRQVRPVPKQWFAMTLPAIIFVGLALGQRLSAFWPLKNEKVGPVLATTIIAACLTWAVNVPSLLKRGFEGAPISECSIKQQRDLNHVLVGLFKEGRVTPENIRGICEYSSCLFTLELAWNPKILGTTSKAWNSYTPDSRWIFGDNVTLFEDPKRIPPFCKKHWSGNAMTLLECVN